MEHTEDPLLSWIIDALVYNFFFLYYVEEIFLFT